MKPPALAVGAGGGLALALLLAPATGSALGGLAAARADLAAAQRRAAAPDTSAVPLVAPGLVTGEAAALAARIRARAKAGGVLVEEIGPARRGGALLLLAVRLSGPEKAVAALADSLEREAPLVRLRGWTIEPVAGGGVRLRGQAVAVRQ